MNRWLKLLFSLLLAASAVGGLFAWRFFHPPWEPWVVAQLSHPPPYDFARPSTAPNPVEGQFGERLRPTLETLRGLQAEWTVYQGDASLTCLAQVIDAQPPGPDCKRWLLKAEPVLPRLDDALASTRAGPPVEQAALRCTAADDYVLLGTAALATTMETSLAIDEDRLGDAVDGCLRALALARDDQWWGFSGVVSSHLTSVLASKQCLVLARAAPRSQRERLIEGAKQIARGLPDAPHIIEQTRLAILADPMGAQLSASARHQLPPEVAHCLALGSDGEKPTLKGQRELNKLWPNVKTFWETMENAARFPDAGLAEALGKRTTVPAGWGPTGKVVYHQWWASRSLPNLIDAMVELDRATQAVEQTGEWPQPLLKEPFVTFKVTDAGQLYLQLDRPEEVPQWTWSDGGSFAVDNAWLFTRPPRR